MDILKEHEAGFNAYKEIERKASDKSKELAEKLTSSIVKEELNITTAIMAVSKTLTHLTSYFYEKEDEFLADVQKARTSVVTDIVPALLDPQPCGLCEQCKNGNLVDCINPKVREDYTETRFLPLVCNMLIEYDMFNKILHMYSINNQTNQEKENN